MVIQKLKTRTTYQILLSALILSGCSCSKNTMPVPEYSAYNAELSDEILLSIDFEKNIGDRVFFATDSSLLSERAKGHLRKQVAWLMSNPQVLVEIQGHCDERASSEYNLILGSKRAKTIKKFLLEHGILSSRISTISYGKELPVDKGHNERAWKQNRRGVSCVTIKVGQD